MSGTSLDGIDVAIVELGRGARGFRLIGFESRPYRKDLREAILRVAGGAGTGTTAEIAALNYDLAEAYADSVLRAVKAFGPVDLIGCHGQTVYHAGGRYTLQLGEAAVIAERTGAPVVSNFRARDIAAGGQGAPLVPYVDYLLFRHPKRTRIALNIGGIANITVIPAACQPDQVTAFDTGPGNMVIDALAQEHTGGRLRYDRGGKIARSGELNRALLTELLKAPYYRLRPPKSAGREDYGSKFVAMLKRSGDSLPNLIATATVLTSTTIAIAVRQFVEPDKGAELIVSGGGARNPEIISHLAALLPDVRIANSADYGIDPDAKEAIAFAILAAETWRGKPANLPSATGARRAVLLGSITR